MFVPTPGPKPHSLVIVGDRNTGKTTFLHKLAKLPYSPNPSIPDAEIQTYKLLINPTLRGMSRPAFALTIKIASNLVFMMWPVHFS